MDYYMDYYMDDTGRKECDFAIWYFRFENYKCTKKYFRIACNKKYVRAMVEFGKFYEVRNSKKDAIYYYNMAVDHGNHKSLLYLGSIYEKIKGYHKDAENCYLSALENGVEESIKYLENYYGKEVIVYGRQWLPHIVESMYESLIKLKSNKIISEKIEKLKECESIKIYIESEKKKLKILFEELEHSFSNIKDIHNIVLKYLF